MQTTTIRGVHTVHHTDQPIPNAKSRLQQQLRIALARAEEAEKRVVALGGTNETIRTEVRSTRDRLSATETALANVGEAQRRVSEDLIALRGHWWVRLGVFLRLLPRTI